MESIKAHLTHDCAFDTADLEELLTEGTKILNAAIDLSQDMENSMANIAAVYAEIDGRDKDGGLGSALSSLQGTLVKEEYSETINHLQTIIGKLQSDVPEYDSRLAGHMDSLGETLGAVEKRIADLQGLLTSGDIGLGYADFTARLNDIRNSWEDTTEELAARLAEIEAEMLGVAVTAVAYSKDPVNLSTGNFIYDHEDLAIRGEIPLSFHRYYNSKDHTKGSLGRCFLHNYEIKLTAKEDGTVTVRMQDGQTKTFHKQKNGEYLCRNAALETLVEVEAEIESAGAEKSYLLRSLGGDALRFDNEGKLLRKEDANGRGITFTYDSEGQLAQAATDNGAALTYSYDAKGYLITVTDHTGRTVSLTYDKYKIATVTTPSGAVYTYEYGRNGRITEITNPRGIITVGNTYDDSYRITHQSFPDGGEMRYEYDDAARTVTLTERNGSRTIHEHDAQYRNIKTIYEDGTSEVFTYNDKNLCTSRTDRNGNTRKMAYDNRGNLTQTVDEAGRKINLTYDADNHLINISINGKERLKNHYDKSGNLLATENAEGSRMTITYGENKRPQTIKTADGGTITLAYDERGNIRAIRDAEGAQTAYAYDDLNRVRTTTDANGNATSYTYDMADRITTVINAAGGTRNYTYNESGKLTELIDYDGYKIIAAYNSLNRIETLTDKEGNETRYTYDLMWNVASETAPDGAARSYTYDRNNRLSSVELPQGGTVTYTYDPNGNRTGITDAEGNHAAFLYDAANRLTEVTEPDGAMTHYAYDEDGNLSDITDALGHIWHYTYDLMGRRTSETDPLGNTTSVLYDAMGKTGRVCYPNGSSMTYIYSETGKLIAITRPDGTSEHYTYDPNGNLIKRENSLGEALHMEYDCLNRVIAVTNPMGGVRRYAYDAVGHVTALTDENGNTTTYTYSPNGNLTKVMDALGNETCYTYDCSGRLTKVERKGISESGASGQTTAELTQTTTYTWNPLGNLETMTDPLGNIERYAYDKNGRMTAKTDRDGYKTVFTYDHAGKVTDILYADGRSVKLSYNALHQLEQVKDWLGSTTIELDALGRPLTVTDPYIQTVGYEWGSMGEKRTLIYPDGTRAAYEYDEAMRLSKLHTGNGEISYEYDDAGRLCEKQLPGGVTTQYAYNSLGRIAQISHEGENVHERYTYHYDAAGNKVGADKERGGSVSWQERILCNEESVDNGNALDSGSYRYVYDALNRLVGVEKDGNTQREYTYDAFGNRTKKVDYTIPVMSGETASDFKTTLYRYNNANQLIAEQLGASGLSGAVQEKTYQYDRRGNLTAVSQGEELLKQFTFDTANRMSGSAGHVDGIWKQAAYQYNGLGQRVGQEIRNLPENPEQSIRYTLDLTKQYHNLLHLGDAQNGKDQTFYWDGNVVSMQEDGREESFYLQDDLGCPMELLDAEGGIRESYAFDEFGVPLMVQNGFSQSLGSEDGTVPSVLHKPYEQLQPFGFTGYQTDAAGGLYFAQARRYDAAAGRFVSEDKVKGFADAPFTLNPYSYCWNKPMELVDLNGLEPNGYIPGGICDTLYGDETTSNANKRTTTGAQDLLQELNGQSAVEKTVTNPLNVFGDMPFAVEQSNYEPCDNEGTGVEIEKICTWLATDYKMTEVELNEAKVMIDNYYKKGTTQYDLKYCSNEAMYDYILLTEMSEEERHEYNLMCALENKCSTVSSFMIGLFNGMPFMGTWLGYTEKWIAEEDNPYAELISYEAVLENSRTQHPIATPIGEGLMYVATSWDVICAIKAFVSKCGTKIANSIAKKSITVVDNVVDDVIGGSANAVDDVLGNGVSVIDDVVGGEVNAIDDVVTNGVSTIDDVIEGGSDIADLANTALKHPLNRHTPSRVANQFKYMSEEAIQNYLDTVTFFNKSWTEEQIVEALNYGYKEALGNGISTGEYSFKYLDDTITIYLEDGVFKSGYGDYVYTYEEIISLLGE
ncbi:MAG: RHS repeat protein [Roseburia sp.]|nr:RHS repeat protein [Roseburia sp.]